MGTRSHLYIGSYRGTWTIECKGVKKQKPPILKALFEIFKHPRKITNGELVDLLEENFDIQDGPRRRVKNLFRHFHFQCPKEPYFDLMSGKWKLEIKKIRKEQVSEPLPN